MAANIERTDLHAAKEGMSFHTTRGRWSWFAAGVAMGLTVVYLGVTRPIAGELSKLERQVWRLEQDLGKLVNKRRPAAQTSDLLSALIEQGERLNSAEEALDRLSELQERLAAQAARSEQAERALASVAQLQRDAQAAQEDTADVLKALDALAELQDRIVRQYYSIGPAQSTLTEIVRFAESARQAASQTAGAKKSLEALADLKARTLAAGEQLDRAQKIAGSWDAVHRQWIQSAADLERARDVGQELISLKDEILCGNTPAELEEADRTLTQLFKLRQRLDGEGQQVAQAEAAVEALIGLKNQLLARTGDLADAVETLETLGDLEKQLVTSVRSFDRLRHWLVEVVLFEPALERSVTLLKPLAELSNLRRLSPADLRQAARTIADQRAARVADRTAGHGQPASGRAPDATLDAVQTD